MDAYQTESQQVEEIKDFFKRNTRAIVVGLVLFCVLFGSMHYWQKSKLVKSSEASDLYQQVLLADLQHDSATLNAKSQEIIDKYSSTPYAQFAAFMLAKEAVDKKDYATASDKLRWVIAKTSKGAGVYIATERLARVLIQQGEYDEALKVLNDKAPSKEFVTLYEEAKGDIYLAKGDIPEAKIAYLKAAQDLPEGAQAPVLHLKLVDLGLGVDNA